jgi:hypothetical protein
MGVTWFRDYLACPYRFYLKRVLRLQVERDDAVELSPPQWGTLAHDALRAFGLDPIRGSSDAHAIEKTLQARLDEIATERFGARPPVAVRVQLEQLRERLSAFASWQARWASEGWEIVAVEVPLDDGQFIVGSDGGRMPLRGRIDRVDRNQRTGECVVFDYKTSDRARTPEQVHRARGRWSDLQLPLYRTLVPDHPTLAPHLAGSVPRVGFVNLPNDADDAGEQLAGWSDEDFADAQQVARTVVDGVRAERFWPPASPPPAFSEAFAAICQQAQFVADDALAEDE